MHAPHRAAALRARILSEDIQALLLTHVINIRYATGFDHVFDDEAAHIAVITGQRLRLYTDSRYFQAATAASEGTEWEIIKAPREVLTEACNDLNRDGAETLAFENAMPFDRHQHLIDRFDGACVPAPNWLEDLRAVKDSTEMRRIEAAQALTDRGFDYIVTRVRPGVTERELALDMEFFLRREGSEGVAFSPIIASGPNSARPHAIPGDRQIASGDLLVMDFGARVGGYCADMTRTVVVGRASDEQRAIYDAVLCANLAGAAAVEPGKPGSGIDAAARAVIAAAGYGDRFEHGLGHGVGLEVHEQPSLGARSSAPVPLGSVITIEPGIYIPGMGGVRIEDLAVVESDGARVLSASTKDLLEV